MTLSEELLLLLLHDQKGCNFRIVPIAAAAASKTDRIDEGRERERFLCGAQDA